MLTNIIQLTAGILLGISSFIKKDSFQLPVFGQKLPGTFENAKQKWVIRIGLLLLILGYTIPILSFDLSILNDFKKGPRVIIAFIITIVLVIISYYIAHVLAKKEYKKAPCVLQNESAEYCSTAWRCYFTWRGEYDSLPLAKPALDIAGFMAYNSCSQRLHVKLQHCVVAVAILCIFSLQNTPQY